jgi:glycosyltransferase involved in cell wall biosynthesis
MKRVSAIVIACNEEKSLPLALASLAWADEIVVVDSGSTDATVALAEAAGARVCHRAWTGFVDQKNHAREQAASPWVFSLDADEECSPELVEAIGRWRTAPEAAGEPAGYRMPRLAWFLGRWIRHSDWYPDHQLRLFRRDAGRWTPRRVHESVRVDGAVGTLAAPIRHYPYEDLGDYLHKMDAYSRLAAEDLWERGRRASAAKVLGAPLVAFFKSYVLKHGFLDGGPGVVVAGMSLVSTFFRYARLYEMGQGNEHCGAGR